MALHGMTHMTLHETDKAMSNGVVPDSVRTGPPICRLTIYIRDEHNDHAFLSPPIVVTESVGNELTQE